ncbi:MAG: metal ABC transporter substrate-binding protein [Syntrophobacterales bacterium]|nr:metal ABC transporter substrate-binding protein [Syntrophobacterales bacterium]
MKPSCKSRRRRRVSTAWGRLTCGPLAGWLLLAACALTPLGPAGAASPEKIPAAASILPLGDFLTRIGGELVQVTVLIPPGASPHVYEPSPAAVAGAARARVLVYVGAGLDPWVSRLVARRGPNDPGVVQATAGLPLIAEVQSHGHDHHKGKGATHRHDQGNPHIWLDPVLAQDICRRIAAALMAVDPEHRETYQANLSRYLAELEALHREIEAAVATFRLREFVSFHPAFTYFARRYGLTEAGVIEAAPGREPTPGQLRRLVATIRRSGVKAVFAEPQLSPRAAEALAREAGVKVLLLDPLGGRPPYGSNYLQLMRHNLAVMQQALQ